MEQIIPTTDPYSKHQQLNIFGNAMADEWIKFRKSLIKDGRVRIVSRTCHANSVTVIGALVTLWCLADDHADDDGVIFGYTSDDINKEVEIEGFCESLPAEWMDTTGDWVKLPDYQEHNGATAKKRAQNAKRQSRTRQKISNADSNANSNANSVTEPLLGALPREDKIREDKNKESQKNKFTVEDKKTSEFILEKILQLNPNHKHPNLETWANEIRLIRERDNRTDQQIRDLFTWANADGFWKTNILSPSKLRQQWDKLTIQKNNKQPNGFKSNADWIALAAQKNIEARPGENEFDFVGRVKRELQH